MCFGVSGKVPCSSEAPLFSFLIYFASRGLAQLESVGGLRPKSSSKRVVTIPSAA